MRLYRALTLGSRIEIMRTGLKIAALMTLSLLLSCGQQGPLYFPDDPDMQPDASMQIDAPIEDVQNDTLGDVQALDEMQTQGSEQP